MPYTIENVPAELEKAIREQMKIEKKNLNAVLLEALARGLDLDESPRIKRDLSFLTEGPPLEPEVIQALEELRQIDPEIWK
jgi:hypothetical protein